VASLRTLDLEDHMGAYDRRAVLGLAESGYDNNKSDKASAAHGWPGLIALRTTRRVTAEVLALTPPHRSRGATATRFAVVIAGASGPPFVGRRGGTHASAWTFASDTPQAPCALGARLRGGVRHGAPDRMGAARLLPAMIGGRPHARW
jgi:hypothetical protein